MSQSLSHDRKTVGAIVQDNLAKASESYDTRELGQEMTTNFMDKVFEVVEDGKGIYPADFFVEVHLRRDRLLQGVMRTQVIHRLTCGSPTYNQSMFKYDRKNNLVDYLWTVPDPQHARSLVINALSLDPQFRDLLQFVLDYEDGTLLKLARKLNNEEKLKTGITLEVLDERQTNTIEEHNRTTNRIITTL